MALKV